MTSAERGAFKGLLQIVRYNYPYYVLGLLMLLAGGIVVPLFRPGLFRMGLIIALALSAWWMMASLLASWWIYDRSPLLSMKWLPEALDFVPLRWGVLHAGLDETSRAVRDVFPNATGAVFNFFDRRWMTESSIQRATGVSTKVSKDRKGRKREIGGSVPSPESIRCSHSCLPLRTESLDAALLIFSAHELRTESARSSLFAELLRTLNQKGKIILVEHLRDPQNFCAFGPGFLHFFSRSVWVQLARQQGLVLDKELKITPFVHLFVWRKDDFYGENRQEGL